MKQEYVLVVRFELKPSSSEGFDQLVAETVPQIRAHEPGTLDYTVHGVEGHANQRIFYERYADRTAFETHEEQPHTKRFLEERQQYLAKDPEVDFCTPRWGVGGV
jgi:quinol monooxygenase YgiN